MLNKRTLCRIWFDTMYSSISHDFLNVALSGLLFFFFYSFVIHPTCNFQNDSLNSYLIVISGNHMFTVMINSVKMTSDDSKYPPS